eukprot:CAMPEP_0114669472 /NCGR_PEP_ID=MMETSP0191-20121206/38139_1 /TAXON_ID=126664 /ORGANISM="Sorites sp." /LENGTH=198 /DNA_ID=CAMNT_0001925243 /DNA_START=886 /DNA_END=1479 /DNA_ORIENTATION=-
MTLDCDLQQLFIGDVTPTVMSYSQNPNGPWSPIQIIPTQNPYGYDSCLSSYIYKNGSFIGLFESDNGFYIEYADDWKDNSTYKYHFINDMPPVGEDPYIWVDLSNNVVHAIFHGGGWDNPWGYHAFSTNNGRRFEGFDTNVHAYEGFTEYDDGTNFTFARCERPHLIMDDDGYTPLALSNAVQPGGQSLDYSFTLIRP